MGKVGVLVGRFQVPQIHSGHRLLFDHALHGNDRVLVFVGINDGPRNTKYPLPFSAIKQGIEAEYKEEVDRLTILPIADCQSHKLWVQVLDFNIRSHCSMESVMLYGGRDSFLEVYKKFGKYKFKEIETPYKTSSTQIRENITLSKSPEFKEGMIYQLNSMPPRIYHTVDVVCYRYNDKNEIEVLLGKKEDDENWRLPGGFVDFSDKDLEMAALRELREETGIGCEGRPRLICNHFIDDYRNTSDTRILTSLYACSYTFGTPKAGDDLAKVEWMNMKDALANINQNHFYLLNCFFHDYCRQP